LIYPQQPIGQWLVVRYKNWQWPEKEPDDNTIVHHDQSTPQARGNLSNRDKATLAIDYSDILHTASTTDQSSSDLIGTNVLIKHLLITYNARVKCQQAAPSLYYDTDI
jgi:hypothetical protein